jgi:hypothetical protein
VLRSSIAATLIEFVGHYAGWSCPKANPEAVIDTTACNVVPVFGSIRVVYAITYLARDEQHFSLVGISSAALWGVVTAVISTLTTSCGRHWTAMRPDTRILYSLCDRIAVRRAERAKRNWQPAKGIRRDIKGGAPWLVGSRVGPSELVMSFSVLGGRQLFGLLGIVMGPIAFAVAASLLNAVSVSARAIRQTRRPRPHQFEPMSPSPVCVRRLAGRLRAPAALR